MTNYRKGWRVGSSYLPGDKGTLKPYQEFGDSLVCVRYRYNAERNRRIKTVEIVIEEVPWRTEVSEARKKKNMEELARDKIRS
jgi:hypothetical protein